MRSFAALFDATMLSSEELEVWDWTLEHADRRSKSATAEVISQALGLSPDGNFREVRRRIAALVAAGAPIVSSPGPDDAGYHIAESGEECDRCGCRFEVKISVVDETLKKNRRAARLFQLPLDHDKADER